MAVYNVNENLTPVLLTTMTTCFMSHLLFLVSRELVLVSILALLVLVLKELALVLLQLVYTTTLGSTIIIIIIDIFKVA